MDRNDRPNPRSIRISLLKWELAAILLVMTVVVAAGVLYASQPRQEVAPLLVYGSLLALGVLLALFWYAHWRRLHTRLLTTEGDLERTRRRMAAAIQLSHQFVEARSEEEIIRVVLRASREVLGAGAATFVPINERGRPYPAVTEGELPKEILRDWAEHLAEPEVRQACARCKGERVPAEGECPLYAGPFRELALVHCLRARRNGQELGILNLYLEPTETISPEDQAFLEAVLNEMAIAVEAVRLREREVSVLRKVKRLEQGEQRSLLRSLLRGFARALNADFALLAGQDPVGRARQTPVACGSIAEELSTSLIRAARDLAPAGQGPVVLSGKQLEDLGLEGVYSLGVFPIPEPGSQPGGRLVFGRYRPPELELPLVLLLNGLADVLGVTLQLDALAGELTYQATLAERARLAREIHDGLAQTLGFLKLTIAQIEGYADRGEQAKIRPALRDCHLTLREAYADARQAIDDLRSTPELGIKGWVEQTADELEALDGVRVICEGLDGLPALAPEAETQLIRIIQEALTNIRKHASAATIRICQRPEVDGWLLEIEDDGLGFDPREVFDASRHGLAGMQERAGLIGAELRVLSKPGTGTRVQIVMQAAQREAAI